MKFVLVLLAVGAAAAGGYLVGDEGGIPVSAWIVGGVSVFALLLYAIVPAGGGPQRVSLRPGSPGRPASSPQARVLRPGDAARLREQERLLSEGGQVALRLIDTGKNQIAVIKVLRNYLDIGLKEAKDISDAAKRGQSPLVTAEVAADVARQFIVDLQNAGAAAQLEERSATQ